MIFTIPIYIGYFLIAGMLAALPESSGLPAIIQTSFEYVFGFLYAFDFIMPVSTLLLILTISLAFEVAVQVWHGIHWIIQKIPMLNMR